MPYRKSPYRFRCFFNKVVWCGEFNPRIWKKRHRLPEPCKRCRFYLNRLQKTLSIFTIIQLPDTFGFFSTTEEIETKKHKKRGG